MTYSIACFYRINCGNTGKGKKVYKVFEVIGHGPVSSYVCLSLRNAFFFLLSSSFQEEIKHKRKCEHICLKIKSGSTYGKFPPTSSRVSIVVNGALTHTHTQFGVHALRVLVHHCSPLILCLGMRW